MSAHHAGNNLRLPDAGFILSGRMSSYATGRNTAA